MQQKYFDDQAGNWDNDPGKIERAKVFAGEIIETIHPEGKMKGFEYGCGTGLLSYFLKDQFKDLVLADNSEGMLNVLEEKIRKENITNMTPLNINLLDESYDHHDLDAVYTLMTMHHIKETGKLVHTFGTMLKKGGYLCIGDLVTEDGSFHSNMKDFDGHKGFDRNELESVLRDNGFGIISYKVCYEITKQTNNGIPRTYPLFLLTGKKR
jgi:ubiquinone/menaquinone biosynthesis C-methylase UbiE